MLYIFASPWDSKEIQPVNPKGNQSWIFIGRTDPEAEAPVVWPPDAKSRLIGKDPSAGKDCDRGTGVAEDEMVGWHHRLNGQEFEQTLGDSEGQGSLACCSPWGCKEPLDMTEQLNKPLHPLYWQQVNKLMFLTAGRPKQLENEGPTGLTPPVNHPQSPTLVGESLQGANHTVQLSIWQW